MENVRLSDKRRIYLKVANFKRALYHCNENLMNEILEELEEENYHILVQILKERKIDLADRWLKENLR